MRKFLLLAFTLIGTLEGTPVSEDARASFLRDFTRSPDYLICIQNVFFPDTEEGASRDDKEESENPFEVLQNCMTHAFEKFSEERKQKRSANPKETGLGSGFGFPKPEFVQCLQEAMNFNNRLSGLGSRNQRSPGEEGGSPIEVINAEQIQICMQKASSGWGGSIQKRSANPKETGLGSGFGFPKPEFVQCLQEAMNFNNRLSGLGSRNQRSPGEEGGSPIEVINAEQIQICMQKASSGWGGSIEKRSANPKETGLGSGFGFPKPEFVQCLQEAMNFNNRLSGLGSRNQRSPAEEGGSPIEVINAQQIQVCMEKASSGWGGSIQKRSANPKETGLGSGFGFPKPEFVQCLQEAMNFNNRLSGLGSRNQRSPGEEGGSPIEVINAQQIQICMEKASSGWGGSIEKRSANPKETGLGSGFGFPKPEFIQCLQEAMNFNNRLSGLGSRNQRSPAEEGGSPIEVINAQQIQVCMEKASSGWGGSIQKRSANPKETGLGSDFGFPKPEFVQCLQEAMNFNNRLSGLGSRNQRSPAEEGGSPIEVINAQQIQVCMEKASSGWGGSIQKRSANPKETGLGSGFGFPKPEFVQCLQEAMNFNNRLSGLGSRNQRSPAEEGGSPIEVINAEQIQICMQKASSGWGGSIQKRSANPKETGLGSGFGFPKPEFVQCLQEAMNFNNRLSGLGSRNQRSPAEEGGSPIEVINAQQIQVCMEKASSGWGGSIEKRSANPKETGLGSGFGFPKPEFVQCLQEAMNFNNRLSGLGSRNQRSPGEEGGSPIEVINAQQIQVCMEKASSGWGGSIQKRSANPKETGLGSGFGFLKPEFVQCLQEAMNFNNRLSGLGSRNQRSPAEEGGSPIEVINAEQIQICMQKASSEWGGSIQKRSANPKETGLGSGFGFPKPEFVQCLQEAMNFNNRLSGLGSRNQRSPGEEGGSPIEVINAEQIQICMQKASSGWGSGRCK